MKIDFENSWVHLRRSNTEAIIRIYSEAKSEVEADELARIYHGDEGDFGDRVVGYIR